MLRRSLFHVTFSALLGIVSCSAFAQIQGHGSGNTMPEPRATEPDFFGQSDPAPDWAVWAAFYRYLQQQANEPSALPFSLFTSRSGIAEDSTLRIMNLGSDYLRTLEHLQEEKRRLDGLATVTVPQGDLKKLLTPPMKRRAPGEADLALKETRTPLRLSMPLAVRGKTDVPNQGEGPAISFDVGARSALDVHQKQLVELIGPRDFAALKRWITSELGAQVRVPRRTYRLPSLDVER